MGRTAPREFWRRHVAALDVAYALLADAEEILAAARDTNERTSERSRSTSTRGGRSPRPRCFASAPPPTRCSSVTATTGRHANPKLTSSQRRNLAINRRLDGHAW